MSAKAVIFTVFDRELLLQRTLESWSRVREKSDFDFYFKIEETSKLPVISKMIDNFEKSIQQPVTMIINSGTLGCALNTWQALDLMFQKYEFVILAEDDFIVSVDVLNYFKNLEEMYRDDRGCRSYLRKL